MEKGATLGRRFEGYTGYPGRWAPRYNTRLPLLAAISVNCSVPDKKNVGKIKFSSVIHHEATDAGRAGSIRIGWLRPKTFTWSTLRTRPVSRRQHPIYTLTYTSFCRRTKGERRRERTQGERERRELDTPDPCGSQSHLRAAFDRAAFRQTSPPSQSTSAALVDRIDGLRVRFFSGYHVRVTRATRSRIHWHAAGLPRDLSRVRDFLEDISIDLLMFVNVTVKQRAR